MSERALERSEAERTQTQTHLWIRKGSVHTHTRTCGMYGIVGMPRLELGKGSSPNYFHPYEPYQSYAMITTSQNGRSQHSNLGWSMGAKTGKATGHCPSQSFIPFWHLSVLQAKAFSHRLKIMQSSHAKQGKGIFQYFQSPAFEVHCSPSTGSRGEGHLRPHSLRPAALQRLSVDARRRVRAWRATESANSALGHNV